MKQLTKGLAAVAACGVLAVGAAACGSESSSSDSTSSGSTQGAAASSEPLKVASIYPYSGPGAIYGTYDDQAWELAFDKFGDDVNGRAVERERLDDKCTPSDAVSVVRQAMGSDILIADAPPCSGSIAAAKELLDGGDLPAVTMSFTPDIVGPDNDWIWQSVPNDAVMNRYLAAYIADHGHQRVGIFHDTNGYGQTQTRTLTEALAEYDIEPVEVVSYETGATDFSGQISRLRSADVDLVFLAGHEAEIGRAASQMRKLKMDVPFMGPNTASTADFLKAAGDAAEGVVFATPFVSTRPEAKEFTTAWSEKFNEPPPSIASLTYVNAMIILNALEAAGENPTRESVNEALQDMNLEIPELGITVGFTDEGAQRCPPIFIGQWAGGKPEVLKDETASCS